MSRWQPGARNRLERAALELFAGQGFAETTVPQITARAGLTTRTFFRHFADKREVLFAVEEELPPLVARLMAEAPASMSPMMVIDWGLTTVAETRFEGALGYLRARRAIIETEDSLRERELRKNAVLAEAVRQGFVGRGLDELAAELAAHIAVTVFSVSVNRWLDQDGGDSLAQIMHDTLRALRAVTAGPAG
jgi:AcrR family transcriptional regulator